MDVSRPLATSSVLSCDIDLLGHLLDRLVSLQLFLVAPSLFGSLRVIGKHDIHIRVHGGELLRSTCSDEEHMKGYDEI